MIPLWSMLPLNISAVEERGFARTSSVFQGSDSQYTSISVYNIRYISSLANYKHYIATQNEYWTLLRLACAVTYSNHSSFLAWHPGTVIANPCPRPVKISVRHLSLCDSWGNDVMLRHHDDVADTPIAALLTHTMVETKANSVYHYEVYHREPIWNWTVKWKYVFDKQQRRGLWINPARFHYFKK